ncbi:MAG: PGF-pre-PGF domain-containing protein [Nanoarchaeota archaeon]
MKKLTYYGLIILIIFLSVKAALAQGIDIEITTSQLPSPPCTPQIFDLNIINLETEFIDEYTFNLDQLNDFATFSKPSLTLAPEQIGTTRLSIILPCDQYGRFDIQLQTKNQGSNEIFLTPLIFEILPTGIPKIAPDVDIIIIPENKSQAKIRVKNLGNEDTTYKVSVEDADFVNASVTQISIPGGEESSFKLIIDPPKELRFQDYPITIVLQTTSTGIEYARQIILRHQKESKLKTLFTQQIISILASICLIGLAIFGTTRLKHHLNNTKDERLQRRLERKAQKEAAKEERRQTKKQKRLENIRQQQAKELAKLTLKEERQLARTKAKHEQWHTALIPILEKEIKQENLVIPKTSQDRPGRKLFWLITTIIVILLGIGGYTIRDVLPEYLIFITSGFLMGITCLLLYKFITKRRTEWLKIKLFNEVHTLKQQLRENLTRENIVVKKTDIKLLRGSHTKQWLVLGIFIIILFGISLTSWLFRETIANQALMLTLATAGSATLLFILGCISTYQQHKNTTITPLGDIPTNRLVNLNTHHNSGLTNCTIKIKSSTEGLIIGTYIHHSQPTFTDPDGIPYKFIELRSNADRNIERIQLTFSIPKSWLKHNTITKEAVILQRYSGGRWKPLTTQEINEDLTKIIYNAESEGIGFFAISGKSEPKPKPTNKQPPTEPEIKIRRKILAPEKVDALFETRTSKRMLPTKKIAIILGILLILLSLVAGSYYLLLQQIQIQPKQTTIDTTLENLSNEISQTTREIAGITNLSGGIPNQLINGSATLINLNQYFQDPEQESLIFSNTPAENLTISYENGIATINSKPGFSGDEIILFTATDPYNNSVSSNPVIISIIQQPTQKVISSNLLIIIAFGLVFITLIIALLFLRR